SMLHHRFPNGFTDLFMDETDREVSTLTDRAFRSLCVGDDAVYNDEFLYGYSPYSCLKPLAGEPFKKNPHKESKKAGQHKQDKDDAQPCKQQQQDDISHMSSFLKVLSITEERNGGMTDSNGESWDKSALRSIERELSEFSSDYHTSITNRHYENNKSGCGSSNKKCKDVNLPSGNLTKIKNAKSTAKLRKLNIKNFFLHSEFSPFQTWTDLNRYPFGQDGTVTDILCADNVPKWYDLPFYKELTEAHTSEMLHTEEVQSCQKVRAKVMPKPAAPLAEKRCSSDGGDKTAAPWRRNGPRAKSVIPANQLRKPPQESNSKPMDENILVVKKDIESVEVKAVQEASSSASTPFSISQLMTPVIPSRQPTETSEILQAVLSPSVLDLLSRPHSEAKVTPEPPVKRETYKSLASSILFNLKDNRKRVKSRYSPHKFKTLELSEGGVQSPPSVKDTKDFAVQLASQEDDTGGQTISTTNVIRAAKEAINAAKNKARSASHSDSNSKQIPDADVMRQKERDQRVSKEPFESRRDSLVTENNYGLLLNEPSDTTLVSKSSNISKEPPPVPKRTFTKSDLQLCLSPDKQRRRYADKASNSDLVDAKPDLPNKEHEPVHKQGKPKHVFSSRQNNFIKHQRCTLTDDEQAKESNLNRERRNKFTEQEAVVASENNILDEGCETWLQDGKACKDYMTRPREEKNNSTSPLQEKNRKQRLGDLRVTSQPRPAETLGSREALPDVNKAGNEQHLRLKVKDKDVGERSEEQSCDIKTGPKIYVSADTEEALPSQRETSLKEMEDEVKNTAAVAFTYGLVNNSVINTSPKREVTAGSHANAQESCKVKRKAPLKPDHLIKQDDDLIKNFKPDEHFKIISEDVTIDAEELGEIPRNIVSPLLLIKESTLHRTTETESNVFHSLENSPAEVEEVIELGQRSNSNGGGVGYCCLSDHESELEGMNKRLKSTQNQPELQHMDSMDTNIVITDERLGNEESNSTTSSSSTFSPTLGIPALFKVKDNSFNSKTKKPVLPWSPRGINSVSDKIDKELNQEEERFSRVTPSSEDIESLPTSTADPTDDAVTNAKTGLPKPPAVLPKSEKAVQKAIKLTNRRMKKEESQKSSQKSSQSSGKHKAVTASSVMCRCTKLTSVTGPCQTGLSIDHRALIGTWESSMEHAILTQSIPMTQRKLLQDPNSGQYFFVDLPVQVKTKTFFDPGTGSYVQLPVQPPDGGVPQAPHVEVLTSPLVVYHSFVPVPLSPMAPKANVQATLVEPNGLEQRHQERGRK
uniref:DUF4585 domain-containing protein n=1 Tax=Poecilia formosa TaxID=48698 RepID=A0A096LWU1_POEFO